MAESTPVIGFERELDAVTADLIDGTSVLVASSYGMGRTYFLRAVYEHLATVPEVDAFLISPLGPAAPLAALAGGGSKGGSTPNERRQVWLIDDAHAIPEETLDEIAKHLATGRVTALLSIETRLDGSFSEHIAHLYARYQEVLFGLATIRRYDLRRMTDEEAQALIDLLPGGTSLSYGVRALIVANAGGLRFAVRELVREAGLAHGAAQFEAVRRVTPRLSLALSRVTSHFSPASDLALGVIGFATGIALEHALSSLTSEAVDPLIAEGWVAVIGPDQALVANPVLVGAIREQRLDREQLTAQLLSCAAKAIGEGRHRRDRATARAIAELWLNGGPGAEMMVATDAQTRHDIIAGAAWWSNDAGAPARALAYADIDSSVSSEPAIVIERFRALRSMGRIEAALGLAADIDLGALEPDQIRHLLRVCVFGYAPSAEFKDLVTSLIAEAQRRGVEISAESTVHGMMHETAHYAWQRIVDELDLEQIGSMRRFLQLRALEISAISALYTGRFELVKTSLVHASRISLEPTSGRTIAPMFELSLLAGAAYARGATGMRFIDTSARLAAATRESAQSQLVEALAIATMVHGIEAHAQGDWETAARDLDIATASGPFSWWLQWWLPQAIIARVDAHLQLGEVAIAESIVEQHLVAIDFEGSSAWFATKTSEAKVALAAGDLARGERIQRELLDHERSLPLLLEHRSVFRHWLLTRDEASASRVLELSATLDYPLGAEFAAAVLAEANGEDRTVRRMPVSPAMSAAVGLIDARATASTELSQREREIALLIAEGLSNRAIAERLFLSVRTVESHVYAARAKVGAVNRGELAAVALSAPVTRAS